jgi:hypothetical protein
MTRIPILMDLPIFSKCEMGKDQNNRANQRDAFHVHNPNLAWALPADRDTHPTSHLCCTKYRRCCLRMMVMAAGARKTSKPCRFISGEFARSKGADKAESSAEVL